VLLSRLLLIACVCSALKGQGPFTLTTNPATVTAGGQPFSLTVGLNGTGVPTAKPSWAVRWNGSVRPTTIVTGSIDQLNATIGPSDIAQPGFAEISIVDQATGVVYPAVAWVLVTADVYVSDLAWDSVRRRFYVSVPSGTSRPNAPAESVVAVDAATGTVVSSVNLGSKPTLLAISDDASYLYVYLSGSSAIGRIALSTFSPDLQIALPAQGYVSWMQVAPGSPRTLAAAEQGTIGTGQSGHLVIYDDASPRPNTAAGAPNRFVMTGPGTIVGGTYINNGYAIASWNVTASGVSALAAQVAPSNGAPLAFGDGWVLCNNGQVIDPSGARQTQQLDLSGLGAFVPGQNRLLMLGSSVGGSGAPELGAYEDSAMAALGRIGVALPYDSYPTPPTRMLVWGTDGVAFVANQQLFFGHTELAAAAPAISAAGIVNSATLITGDVAPGEILSFFGSNLGTAAGRTLEFSEPRQVSTNLGQTQVWFDGFPGTMLYAGSGQINVVAPFELAGKTSTRIQVWYQGIPSAIVPMQVSLASPGLFTQDGSGEHASATLNSDGTLNTPAQPAPAGSVVALFGNGGGATQPALADGEQDIYAWPLAASVKVLLNGEAVPVLYAGSAPGLVAGVVQVNFQIPAGFPPSAAATVQLSVAGIVSPSGVTMSTR
jgi:uncharacterized protein (TIGR03437 family)